MINAYAWTQMAGRGREACILFDGRRASLAGAAFVGAATIDALDGHDGHVLTKGHACVAVLPALLAFIDGGPPCTGAEFITCLVVGYEVATRAGIALHASVADYHYWTRVRIVLRDGRTVVSEPTRARGNPENPLSDSDLRGRYRELAEPVLGPQRSARVEARVDSLAGDGAALSALADELLNPGT